MDQNGLTEAGRAGAARHAWRRCARGRSTGRGRAGWGVGSARRASEVPVETDPWRWLHVHRVVDEDLGWSLWNRWRRVWKGIAGRRGWGARQRPLRRPVDHRNAWLQARRRRQSWWNGGRTFRPETLQRIDCTRVNVTAQHDELSL